jgi:hypothetical protein
MPTLPVEVLRKSYGVNGLTEGTIAPLLTVQPLAPSCAGKS